MTSSAQDHVILVNHYNFLSAGDQTKAIKVYKLPNFVIIIGKRHQLSLE